MAPICDLEDSIGLTLVQLSKQPSLCYLHLDQDQNDRWQIQSSVESEGCSVHGLIVLPCSSRCITELLLREGITCTL